MDAVDDAAARVLFLLRRHQGLGIGAFDADEDAEEIRLAQKRQQFVVVGEVERRLGREFEREVALDEPAFEIGQEAP